MRRRMMRVMSAQQATMAAAPGAGAVATTATTTEPYVLLGGDGSPVVKLKESDAKRIQEHAGESAEDLEDSDLQESMQELGIHSLPLTDADRKTLGMAPSAPAAAPPPRVAPPPPAPAAPSVESQLQQFANMRDKGLISPEDYEAKKKQILGL